MHHEHPTPSDMARTAHPDDKADFTSYARFHYAKGVEAERARLLAILSTLDKGDWLPGRLRDLVKSLEAGQTWYQASWCVPDVGRVYGPACSSHRAATLTVPAFSSDRDPLIYEVKSKADLRKQTAFLYTPDRRSPTTEWAMGEREGREEWEAEQRAKRAGPPPPEVCPFCKSSMGFGNYHGMLYTLCASEACKLRMVLIDGEWKPDPSSGNETARIWASNPILSGGPAKQVIAALRNLAGTMTKAGQRPASVPLDDLLLVEKSEAIRLLCVLRDTLPKGERRAAANGQIATLQREPIPAEPAEVLGWASDWEAA